MGLLITFGSSLLTIFGALEIAGMFFGLVCVILLVLWKINSALYELMLKIPLFLLKFILLPIAWLCLFAWHMIWHPRDLGHLLWLIFIGPLLFMQGFFSAIFTSGRPEETSQSPKRPPAILALPPGQGR